MKNTIKKIKENLSEIDFYLNEGVIFEDEEIKDLELIKEQLGTLILSIKTFNTNKRYNPKPILEKLISTKNIIP